MPPIQGLPNKHQIDIRCSRILLEETKASWALVAHICNPSYSGGRDQED
jgi:hypothetical protein